MSNQPPEPDVAGRYLRQSIVGEGGMGRVWRALDRRLNRLVAFKEAKGPPDSPAAARMRREAVILARLSHPAIVPLLDAGDLPDGRPFLAMRLLAGVDLECAPIPVSLPDRLHRIHQLRDVVAGVAHAHKLGIVHRDLKPANVRFEPDGAVQILDWGLARVLPDCSPPDDAPAPLPLTRVGTRIGTPAYMSPEQAAGEEASPASDVWSLGILLWEAMCGRRAYEGQSTPKVLAGVLSAAPASVKTVAPDTPDALAKVIDGALSPTTSRPPDAGALRDQLDDALDALTPPGRSWHSGAVTLVALATLVVLVTILRPVALSEGVLPAQRVIELANRAGSVSDAELAAAARLETHPNDPVARGALIRGTPRPRLLWATANPNCTIGEVIRWDGRAIACASERQTRFFEVDETGMRQAWSRSEEYHQLVFSGPDRIVAVPPASDLTVSLNIEDGSGTAPFGPSFGDANPTESRTARVVEATTGDAVLRAVLDDTTGTYRITTSPTEARTGRSMVLSDGSTLYLRGADLIRTPPDGSGERMRWTVPEPQGAPHWFSVSETEQHVIVGTSRGLAAVASLHAPGWSPWAAPGLDGIPTLSVASDGQHAVCTNAGDVLIWSVPNPSDHIRMPGSHRTARFLGESTVLTLDAQNIRLWHLDRPLSSHSRLLPGAVRAIHWTSAGMAVQFDGGAVLWDGNGAEVTTLDDSIASAAEEHGAGRLLVASDHTVHIYRPGHPPRTVPTRGCSLVAWPSKGPIVCASTDGGPTLIDATTGAVDTSVSLPRHRWYSIGATGSHVLLMDWDTRIYSLVDGHLTQRLTVPWTTRVLPDKPGTGVYLNGRDGLYRRSLDDAAQTRVSRSHYRDTRFALSPDGDRMAVASVSGGIKVWDATEHTLLLDIPTTLGRIRALAWSPDGNRLAVGNDNGVVSVLDLSVLDARSSDLIEEVRTAWTLPPTPAP